jgi:two-component system sensor histidine kinase KdpD
MVREHLFVGLVTTAVTALCLAIPQLTIESDGLLYLLAIILMSLKVGRWPMLVAAILSATIWEYIFVEPRWAFALNTIQDILMVCIYVVLALVAGQFADRIRSQAKAERLREESDRLHRTLLESVSHELRTPLSVITSALESLEQSNPAAGTSPIGEMHTAVRRLNRMVSNLLDQSRLEGGSLHPRIDWCDAADILHETLEGVRDALAGRALTVVVPEDLPPVKADFGLTEHALANLLLNAARHTPHGTAIHVEAGLTRSAKRAYFRVTDSGAGLPAPIRARLFEKFVRGDGARAGGLGLGLSICRGFMAAQGGDVTWEENPRGGSIFTIYLPHTSPQPEPFV